jgi:hypothetical protein
MMKLNNTFLLNFFIEHKTSEINQKIVLDYLDSFGVEKEVTQATIRNSQSVMQHVLKHIYEDLDKLTRVSVKKQMVSVSKLIRDRDGKPASKGTKKMYRTGFAQFLRWFSKEYGKPEYKEFAENGSVKSSVVK